MEFLEVGARSQHPGARAALPFWTAQLAKQRQISTELWLGSQWQMPEEGKDRVGRGHYSSVFTSRWFPPPGATTHSLWEGHGSHTSDFHRL